MRYIDKLEPAHILDLSKEVPIAEEQILSKTLVQRPDLGMTLFSLDKGQEIGRHSSPGDALVQVLSGKVTITIADKNFELIAGQSILMPAEIPHALFAKEAFQMLLTVVKPEADHD
ncbi:cupin domain-containing protein [Streptococcus dentasini]